MARKTQQGRRAPKKQSRVQGKEEEEVPSGPAASAEATDAATGVPEPAKLAQDLDPATPAVTELVGEQSGSDPVAPPALAQPKELALASDAPLAVEVLAPAQDSTSAALLTKGHHAEPAVDVATPSEAQRPEVVHEDPAQAGAAAYQPQEPSAAAQSSTTAVETIEEQAEDSALAHSLPQAHLVSPLTDVVIASGPPKSDAVPAATTTVPEDPMPEIEEPSLAALADDSAAMVVDEPVVTKSEVIIAASSQSDEQAAAAATTAATAPEEPSLAALADDSAVTVVDEPVVTKSEVIIAASSQSDEQAAAAATTAATAPEESVQPQQDEVDTASDAILADVPEAVEAAPVVKAAVAEEAVEPVTTEKISKLEVQTDLHPRMAGTPSPCRERVSPSCEASRATNATKPRDCMVMATDAIWKLFFGGRQQQQQEQQEQQAR